VAISHSDGTNFRTFSSGTRNDKTVRISKLVAKKLSPARTGIARSIITANDGTFEAILNVTFPLVLVDLENSLPWSLTVNLRVDPMLAAE
jgi:hypothetical protein